MKIHKNFLNTIRLLLRMHVILHVFEAYFASVEGAWITFSIIVFTGIVQLLAAWLLPDEHVHLHNPLWQNVHKHK